ncbi:hypothetical protein BGZ76_000338 [Entomortierella beljakovae]|nr:hypothetical protein BGZ76_000338 [Entomortierella beljakovae]
MKSYTTILLVAALVALSATTVSGQATPTTASASTTTTTTTTGSTASSSVTAAPAPGGNITSMPNFSSLATLISSFAADRSAHPGNSPTPGSGGENSAGGMMLSEQSRGTVMIGLAMVFATTLLAVVGTVSL